VVATDIEVPEWTAANEADSARGPARR